MIQCVQLDTCGGKDVTIRLDDGSGLCFRHFLRERSGYIE